MLAEWLLQVADEHRRLADHFERPVELRDLEKAWVRLELTFPEDAERIAREDKTPGEQDDLAASPGGRRVLRGGSCWDGADWARSAFRDAGDPDRGIRDRGFRVLAPSPLA